MPHLQLTNKDYGCGNRQSGTKLSSCRIGGSALRLWASRGLPDGGATYTGLWLWAHSYNYMKQLSRRVRTGEYVGRRWYCYLTKKGENYGTS